MNAQRDAVSLLSGWLPLSVYLCAAVTAAVVLLGRGRWLRIGLPLCLLAGAAVAGAADTELDSQGVAGEPAPTMLWVWIAVAVATGLAAIIRFRSGRWRGRIVSVVALPLALIAALLVLNQWVGYYRTVEVAWSALTAGPLPEQTALGDLAGLRGVAQKQGRVVPVDIPDTRSGFSHRTEYVYLPPAWFAGAQPPALPAIEMIGGEFNTPADWIRLGSATRTADEYAAEHAGRAPILVFVDAGGSFNNDTECVDGSRGNAASHLNKDVRDFVTSTFGVPADAAHWGAIGWSMGGTCAMDLVLTHPELYSSFGDIGGDLGPNTGTKAQTVARLFGGDVTKWDQYDPRTVMARHGTYANISGVFVDADGRGPFHGAQGGHGATRHGPPPPGGAARGGPEPDPGAKGSSRTLCNQMRTVAIGCTISSVGDGHTWQSASAALRTALPAVAGRLGGAAAA